MSQLSFYATPEMIQLVDEARALAGNLTRSKYIRRALERQVKDDFAAAEINFQI
jgi:hypothetical protein